MVRGTQDENPSYICWVNSCIGMPSTCTTITIPCMRSNYGTGSRIAAPSLKINTKLQSSAYKYNLSFPLITVDLQLILDCEFMNNTFALAAFSHSSSSLPKAFPSLKYQLPACVALRVVIFLVLRCSFFCSLKVPFPTDEISEINIQETLS